jgi:hypothetical protein
MTTPLPVLPGTFLVTLKWHISTAPGVSGANVLCFTGTGTPSISGLATALNTNVANGMFALQNQNANIYEYDIRNLDGIHAAVPFNFSTARGGTATGDAIPAVAALISLRTGLLGPRKRGRIFLPFVAENMQQNGTLDPTTVTSVQTAWNTFDTNMTTAGYPMAVLSRVGASVTYPVTKLVEATAATQRRRQSRLR